MRLQLEGLIVRARGGLQETLNRFPFRGRCRGVPSSRPGLRPTRASDGNSRCLHTRHFGSEGCLDCAHSARTNSYHPSLLSITPIVATCFFYLALLFPT